MHTIESVVIMYGDITFACFQTGGVYLSPSRKLAGLTIPEGPSFDATTLEGKHFALEDVPTTPNVNSSVGRKRFPFEGTDGDEQEAQQAAKRQRPALQPPTLPRLQTSAPSPVGEMASPLQNNHLQQQGNGLSISTAGSMFRQNLEVDSMSAAGGISPTVASASAILGSLGDVMQQRQQQRTPLPPSPLQHSSTNPDGGRLPPPAFGPQAHHSVSPTAPAFPPPTAPGSGLGPSYDVGNMLPPLPRSPFERQGGTGDSYFSQGSSSHAGQGGDGKNLEQGQPSSYGGGGGNGSGAELEASASAEWPLFERHERPGELAVTGPTGGKRGRHRPDGPVFKPNVKACESCGTINSPEWRKGPSGVKSLCNACGECSRRLGSPTMYPNFDELSCNLSRSPVRAPCFSREEEGRDEGDCRKRRHGPEEDEEEKGVGGRRFESVQGGAGEGGGSGGGRRVVGRALRAQLCRVDVGFGSEQLASDESSHVRRSCRLYAAVSACSTPCQAVLAVLHNRPADARPVLPRKHSEPAHAAVPVSASAAHDCELLSRDQRGRLVVPLLARHLGPDLESRSPVAIPARRGRVRVPSPSFSSAASGSCALPERRRRITPADEHELVSLAFLLALSSFAARPLS